MKFRTVVSRPERLLRAALPIAASALSTSSIATLLVYFSNSLGNGMGVERMSSHAHDLFVCMWACPLYLVFRPFVRAHAEFQT